MRPKKRILLAASQEQKASEIAYMLHIRGFVVITAKSLLEASSILDNARPDLVLVEWPLDGCIKLVGLAAASFTPSLVLADKEKQLPECFMYSPAIVALGKISSADLYERCKVMTIRKRGPRKSVASLPAMEVKKLA